MQDGNIPTDQTIPTQPINSTNSDHVMFSQKLESEPNFDHIHPIESAAEVTEGR